MPPKKQKKTKRSVSAAPVMVKAITVQTAKTRRKRSRKPSSMPASDGVITVQRLELLKSVQASVDSNTSTSGTVAITPGSLTWLKNLSSSFERYRWESVQIFWRGAAGTTFGGLMAFGIDWAGAKKLSALSVIDRSKVVGLTPLCDVPLYTDSQNRPLVLPKQYLNSRQWYSLGGGKNSAEEDLGPGNLAFSAYHDAVTASKFLGEFWVRYRVTLQGSTEV